MPTPDWPLEIWYPSNHPLSDSYDPLNESHTQRMKRIQKRTRAKAGVLTSSHSHRSHYPIMPRHSSSYQHTLNPRSQRALRYTCGTPLRDLGIVRYPLPMKRMGK